MLGSKFTVKVLVQNTVQSSRVMSADYNNKKKELSPLFFVLNFCKHCLMDDQIPSLTSQKWIQWSSLFLVLDKFLINAHVQCKTKVGQKLECFRRGRTGTAWSILKLFSVVYKTLLQIWTRFIIAAASVGFIWLFPRTVETPTPKFVENLISHYTKLLCKCCQETHRHHSTLFFIEVFFDC